MVRHHLFDPVRIVPLASQIMSFVSFEKFESESASFDSLVLQTPDTDRFCSSSAWILSAYEAFSPDFETWILSTDEGYVPLVQSTHERIGRFRQPMEASWCLANPFASPHPRRLAVDFIRASLQDASSWDLLFLSGIVRDSELYNSLIEGFSGRYFVGLGHPVTRFVASLEDGHDGFLSRRSSKFRANLRKAARTAEEQGVSYEYLSEFTSEAQVRALLGNVLLVEARSWKGKADTGIKDGAMQTFYAQMLPRLASEGRLRVLFVWKDGVRIGFVFGGLLGDTYRGLQMSYDDSYRSMSIGNLAQWAMIQNLCEENVARYDLGSELEYKGKWAEERVETVALVVRSW